MKHQKHGKATRLKMGNYGRFELAFLGTDCGSIESMAQSIAISLSSSKVSYIDANHNHDEQDATPFSMSFLDQQSYGQVDHNDEMNKYDHQFTYQSQDIILVNGNHFQADQQVVFLNRKKETSLLKRKDQLTNIRFFIQTEEKGYFPDFLNDIEGVETLDIIPFSDNKKVVEKIQSLLLATKSPVYGLVLAGGRSTRMGVDKGKIQKQGKDLRLHIYEALSSQVEQCYFSGRGDQMDELSDYPFIEDRLNNMGPFGAIVSAFMYKPDAAWLVVACDQPNIEANSFSQLLKARDMAKIATCFHSDSTGFPDPLPAIWEPKAYSRLLDFMGIGYSCPRKVLINSDIKEVHPTDKNWLFNMNTPEDAKKANLKV